MLIWQTIYGNVIVGPTAEYIESKTDRSNSEAVLADLQSFAEEKIPILKNYKPIGSYSGIRPATEHSDYQIKHDTETKWTYVGGIRSTGYSASSAIGEYVADLVSERVAEPIKFQRKVPSLEQLVENYDEKDQTTIIYDKRVKVTHPISIFGLQKPNF